eukprot:GSChrysophyteH1.ASY1.ANO1.1907.1 assembled CDS
MSDDGVTQVYQFDGQTVWLDRGTPLLEVGNFLGGGAAGTVYECEHTQTHEHYALKILNPLDFVRRRSRIFREIENMRKISNHENVIRLEGVLELIQESKCTIFLIMELANGGELFDRIKVDCGTRESTAKYFFQQLLEGVQHCHGQGVCHRDLKPENLLLQDAGKETVLKIADFGFSARFLMGNANSGGEEIRRWKPLLCSSRSFASARIRRSESGYLVARRDSLRDVGRKPTIRARARHLQALPAFLQVGLGVPSVALPSTLLRARQRTHCLDAAS